VIPAAFDYVVAHSVEEAISLLVEHGDEAKLLAGGHSLVPMMKLRLATPAVLVDVARVEGLADVDVQGDEIRIGAMTTHARLETDPRIASGCPLLAHVAHLVGDPQVRHRGTLGGTLAHGDPASDLPAAVLALGGTIVAEGPGGRREIAATDFFTSFLETALNPEEIITEVRVPVTTGGWSYQKFNRRAQDWAIVGVAAVEVAGERRVSLVNMGLTPMRAVAVESALSAGSSVADAAALASEGTSAPDDGNGSSEFREHLARVLTERALDAVG
jgi:carbon-monoxide dehydrogenase medium subunit